MGQRRRRSERSSEQLDARGRGRQRERRAPRITLVWIWELEEEGGRDWRADGGWRGRAFSLSPRSSSSDLRSRPRQQLGRAMFYSAASLPSLLYYIRKNVPGHTSMIRQAVCLYGTVKE